MRIFTHRLIYRIACTLVNVLVLLWLPVKGSRPIKGKGKGMFSLFPDKISTYFFNLTNNSGRVANTYTGTMKTVFFCFMFLFLLSAGQVIAQSQTFTANGTFTVPAGVTVVQVECWGGGGAGGGCSNNNNRGGGGGAGGTYTNTSNVSVTPGATITVTVGSGGTGVSVGNGNAGGTSSFGGLVSAIGGGGGVVGNNPAYGAGAITANGVTMDGGAGSSANSGNGNSGAGGGGAGNGGNGGAASGTTGGNGGLGSIPGGSGASGRTSSGNGNDAIGLSAGGGGARNGGSANPRTGGNGFTGQVIISWICPTYNLTATSATPVCKGSASTVTLTSSVTGLPVGTYTVTYNLSGSNIATGTTAIFNVITAGTATFNTSILVNTGPTTITITNLASGICSSNISSYNLASIVVSSPTAQPGAITGVVLPCEGSTQVYSVSIISSITYTWTVPTGWTITAGQGTNSISVSVGTSGQNGNITVKAGNSCGTSAASTLAATVISVPAQTSPITPPTPNVCQNSTQNYLVNPPPPAGVTYTWSGPPGSTILSGQGTELIVIKYGNTSGTLTITPSNICGNGPSQSLVINIIISTPALPGLISGLVAPCIGTSQNYSIPMVNGVYYTWTAPPGWTISAGQGTNTITAVIGASAGDVVVIAGNACGGSGSRSLAVVPQGAAPAQPSAITGNIQVCIGSPQTYSIANIAFVTYTWSVPADWIIISGQGTNTIDFTVGATSGNISVIPSNSCSTGTQRTMAVSVNAAVPADPGPIIGNNNPCESSSQVYSVSTQSGISYAWTITGGNTITSGQGTNSIVVAVSSNPGTLTVTPSNACGNGPVKSMLITVIPLPASSGAITGSIVFCEGTSQTFSVVNVPGYTYNWTVPAGWTVTSGQGTNAITATSGINSGNIQVAPANLCGTGPVSTLVISVNPLPAAFVGNDKVICTGASVQIGGPAVPGNSYSWTSLPAGFISNISNPIVTPLLTTIYYLIETNLGTGCTKLKNMTVTANQIIVVSVTPASQVICTGSATNIVLSSNISGTLFSWTATLTGIGTTFNTSGAGNVISEVITNTSSLPSVVTYTITATATVCVNASTTVVVTINPAPLVTGQTKSICSDSPSGITLGNSTNGVPVVSYNITNINTNGLLASAGSPSTGNGLAANVIADDAWTNTTAIPVNVVYTVAPVSALGCAGNPFTVTLTINPKPTVSSAVTYGICSGSATSINLTATLPSTFSWTIGAITGGITGASAGLGAVITQTLTNPGNSADGTIAYIVTPTSVTGSCPGAPTTVLVTVHPKPAVTNAATTAICSGTTLNIPLTATVASTFSWTLGTITGAITGAASGSGAIINQVLTNPSNTVSGTVNYLITPTSQGSLCVGSPFTITVTVNPIPIVTASSSAGSVCDGTTFNLFSSSPISNPTISWTSIPIGFISALQNPVNVSQVAATVYTVSYTNTITGCSNSASVTVTSKPVPIAAISPDYCAVPGKIRLTATGGGTYLWNTGQTTQVIDVDIVGSYSVIVTGANGCNATAFLSVSIELVNNEAFTNGNTGFNSNYTYYPDILFVNNELVPDNGTNGYGVGTNGQNYHPNFWGIDHTNNSVGPKNFMLVNGHGNSLTIWRETVNILPNTDYYFSAWAMSLNNVGPYARLQFEVNGIPVGSVANLGAGPANAAQAAVNNYWTRFYSTPKWNSGVLSGPVVIRIINNETSANGNDFGLDDISFGTLSAVPFTFNPSASGGTNVVCEGQKVQLFANIVGGIAPYYFSWTGPNGFISALQDPIINNIPASGQGIYKLSMYDSYGCTPQQKTVYITVNPAPSATLTGGSNACQYAALPVLTFTATGGIAVFTFTYTINGGANQTISTFGASNTAMIFAPTSILGTFTYTLVSVVDGRGCTRIMNTSTMVVVNPLPISTISGNNPVCSGSTGNIYTGNSGMNTYAWTITGNGSINGVSNTISVNITAGAICGDYLALNLVVNNINGCNATAQESILVDDNFPPIITNCPPARTFIGINVSIISPLPYSATTVTITAAQFGTEGGLATDNCAIGKYTYIDTQSGTSPIIVNRTFTVTDKCGNPATCIQIITINIVPPDITCINPLPVNAGAGLCTAIVDPPEPTVNAGSPVTWTWVMSGATIASGSGAIGNYTFNVGVTTITWTATNISGTDICAQLITVLDNQPPTFAAPPARSYCVNNIITAIFNGTNDINPFRPDYYIFKPGDLTLDITGIADNCCAPVDMVIHWRIDFTPTPDPIPPHSLLNTPSVSGTGQPSAHIGNIEFPGDGVYFLNVTHKILYWMVDCHNNTSAITTVDITIKPRPNVIKM